MADQALSAVVDAPVRASAQLRYGERSAGAPRPSVSISLTGSLDHKSRRRLATAVTRCRDVNPVVPFTSVAHVDLTDVTNLEPAGLDLVNELHAMLSAAGWLVRVTPPDDVETRVVFHRTAIRGELRWA